ncbi:hypothetical protein [Actinospica robiniae]|uniref:hypothetical protein n=1 Tax=Actinospica robiniae TaxID=304901 RepID=UPI00054E9476|nr:hypothetical protein [Actinospica robiniae]
MGLDRLLLSLSWQRPDTAELAAAAVARLRCTGDGLRDLAAEGLGGRERRGLEALRVRIGFALSHWEGELASLGAREWTREHGEALAADLSEIARAGAALRDLVCRPAPTALSAAAPSASVPAETSTRWPGRHRGSTQDLVLSEQHGETDQPPARLLASQARMLTQSGLVVIASAAVLAICLQSFAAHGSRATASKTPSAHTPTRPIRTPASTPLAERPSAPSAATDAGEVTSLQIQLLGAGSGAPRIAALFYLDTTGTGPVDVQITYRGTAAPSRAVPETKALSGATSYKFALGIDAVPYCGAGVVVSASAGAFTASQSTSAGPCPTPATTT